MTEAEYETIPKPMDLSPIFAELHNWVERHWLEPDEGSDDWKPDG